MFKFFKISGIIVAVLSTGCNKKDQQLAISTYREMFE